MCGICGIYSKSSEEISRDIIIKMRDVMIHRGPDDAGLYIAPHIALGHRRLSIIDLSPAGHQPMSNEDGTLWIVCNGEIYNYLELREDLIKRGHIFKSKTDTEVILHLFEENGIKSLDFLNGMFAFAIFDKQNKTLTLVRDRLGVKPLYYFYDGKQFAFASELKALLCIPGIGRAIRKSSLNDYFCYSMVPAPNTIFENIYKLKPAHFLQFSIESKGIPQQISYWHLKFLPDYDKTEDEWVEETFYLLKDAVQKRLISDVPLGVFLSGGIDSSLITAITAKITGHPIKTFSIGFKEESHNELPIARKVAEKYKTEAHEEILEIDALSILPKLVKQCDEPFADSSIIPTYYVCKTAKQFVTVALSGDGGDEPFAGYNQYYRAFQRHFYDFFPNEIRSSFFKMIQSRLHYTNPYFTKIARLSLKYPWEQNFTYSYFPYDPLNTACLMPAWKSNVELQCAYYKELLPEVKEKDFLTQMQYFDFNMALPNDFLVKVDRASMLNSLEVRNPFLDYRLVELAGSIPSSIKMKGGKLKYILKRIATQLLPAEVVNHPKKGFSIPLQLWFHGHFLEHVKEILNEGLSVNQGFLDRNKINYLIELQSSHKARDLHNYLWQLLVFEYWCREYLN